MSVFPRPFKVYESWVPPMIHLKPAAENGRSTVKVGPPRRELRREWRPKKRSAAAAEKAAGTGDVVSGSILVGTSVMIKNIPNQIKRDELLQILDQKAVPEHNSVSLTYDFVYLPMDFKRHANYGYAFVNFTTAEAALQFQRVFHNLVWSSLGYQTKKICQTAPAKIQGKKALVKQFKESVFPCCSDEYLPVVLSLPPPSDGSFSSSRPAVTVIGRRSGQDNVIA